jgi:hypothetical protein
MTLRRLIDAVAYALLRPLLAPIARPTGGFPESEFLWIEVPEGAVGRSPAWMRQVGLAPDGTIYLPAAFAGDEREMANRAIRDGQYPVTHKRHAFVPADWLARTAPDKADLRASVEKAMVYISKGKGLA